MASNICKTSETSRATKIQRFLDNKYWYFDKNQIELLRPSPYYQPCFINPLLTDKQLDYLMYTDNSQEPYTSIITELRTSPIIPTGIQVENQGSWAVKQSGGYNCNNRKKAVEFLTDEQYNDLLHMFTEANLLPFSVIDDTIFAGPRSNGTLSCPGYRIPNQNQNPANINQAQNGTVNAGNNINQAQNETANNDQNEAANIGAANILGGDGDAVNNDENQRLVIYRYELNGQNLRITLEEQIQTNIIANDCQSWDDLAENILQVWRQRNPGCIPPVYDNVSPANCWPRAETIFGERSDSLFQSLNWRIIQNFGQFKMYLNCLLVIENVNGFANGVANSHSIREDGRITTYYYKFQHEEMEIDLMSHSVLVSASGTFQSWLEVAYSIHYLYTTAMQIEFDPYYAYNNVDAANCWPGGDTIFGNWVNGRFKSLN